MNIWGDFFAKLPKGGVRSIFEISVDLARWLSETSWHSNTHGEFCVGRQHVVALEVVEERP